MSARAHRRVVTTGAVWRAVLEHHHSSMEVFSSYSAPDGDRWGDPQCGVMQTTYGMRGCEWPLIEARTTWDIERDPDGRARPERKNERHEYWLCLPVAEGCEQ